MEDMADKALARIGQQKILAPDKPLFVYFAPEPQTHLTMSRRGADKYKSKFNQGWDKLPEEIFARQKKLGVLPPGCKLTVRHKEIQSEALKHVLQREMEIYSGFLGYTDHQIGRLFGALKKLDVFDDTFVFYIIGDITARLPKAQ